MDQKKKWIIQDNYGGHLLFILPSKELLFFWLRHQIFFWEALLPHSQFLGFGWFDSALSNKFWHVAEL